MGSFSAEGPGSLLVPKEKLKQEQIEKMKNSLNRSARERTFHLFIF